MIIKNKYIKIRGNNMSIKNLETRKIFNVLNNIKRDIGLAVSDFMNGQIERDKAILNMENRFNNIIENINDYFSMKKTKKILKIEIELNNIYDIKYWNDKGHLKSLRIDFAHKFEIPIKDIEIRIIH